MAGSLNRVFIIGNLTRDPEVRSLNNGKSVCNLSVATSESWLDKTTNERKTKAEYHRVVIFNDNLVGLAQKFLRKGAKIFIEGQLQTRKWTDKDGAEKYSTEIVIQGYSGSMTMLGGNPAESGAPAAKPAVSAPATAPSAGVADDPFGDEIPF